MTNDNWKEEIEDISPLLASGSRQMPFALPEGYFEQTKPVALPTEMPHSLPAGYFDTLATQVVARAKQTEAPPAMKAVRGGKMKTWWAAAAATLVMAIGIQQFMVADRNGQLQPASTGQTSSPGLSETEINEFLRQPVDALPASEKNQLGQALNELSETELQQYLQQPEPVEKPVKGI